MGYASSRRPPDWSKLPRVGEATVIVPAVIPDWLPWFRWHAQLGGTGAILGPSRGVPEVGPRVVEMLPLAPSFASPRTPPAGASGVTFPPPNPGRPTGGWRGAR